MPPCRWLNDKDLQKNVPKKLNHVQNLWGFRGKRPCANVPLHGLMMLASEGWVEGGWSGITKQIHTQTPPAGYEEVMMRCSLEPIFSAWMCGGGGGFPNHRLASSQMDGRHWNASDSHEWLDSNSVQVAGASGRSQAKQRSRRYSAAELCCKERPEKKCVQNDKQ